MDFTYIASIFSLIFICKLFYLIKNNNFKSMKSGKAGLIICIVLTLTLSTYLPDSIAILGHRLDFFELPSQTGTISEIHINTKIGASSTIVLNNEEYDIDLNLLNNRNIVNDGKFSNTKKYKIFLTPIHKYIYNIIELSDVEY
ncbi:hypothetical protein [Crassaminicella profunda]|uniref:hypothetical protein n=1 Tax=Crassaminicella profunda TaxID=1286698 RepID=UPI001CA62B9B|nr:hypothetical protein [Crassaminicella profunda]QZY56694.1 hypothetical protein K7H06_07175 [Crassaminicella profunda]